jgi:phosphate-selective porin
VLCLGAGIARAQDADPNAARLNELEKKVAEQQREIEALKQARPAAPAAPAIDEKSGAEAAATKTAPPKFEWGFNDGFFVSGELNGTGYSIRPRARIQLDYRAFPHSDQNLAYPHPIPEDQFLVRRARFGFDGNFGVFKFDFEADPTRSGNVPLGDFWLQYSQFEAFQVRAGHFKAPFTLEDGMTADIYLETIERSMIGGSGNTVAPDFHPGAEVFGVLADGLFNYFLAAQNQADSNTVTATGDPLVTARVESDVEKELFVGVSSLFTRLGGPIQTSFPGRTPGQFQFFNPVSVRGWEQAYNFDAALYHGPFWMMFEAIWAQQERLRVLADGTNGTPLVTQGGEVTVGWMFFGPSRDSAAPHGDPFDEWQLFSMDIQKRKNARNVGLELLVRLEWMDLEDARGGRRFTSATETTVATPSTAANAAKVKGNDCKALTVGLNLDATENVRFMADYVHLDIGDKSRAERAHSHQADEFLFRAQLEF